MRDKTIPKYTISSAAELLGVSIPTLRLYEKEGLLIPYKKKSNHRRYSESDLERVRCIRFVINEDKISIAGIKRILSLIPCWDLLGCTEEDRAECLAFKDHTKPCWNHNHTEGICGKMECRECKIYNHFASCNDIKESIIARSLNFNMKTYKETIT